MLSKNQGAAHVARFLFCIFVSLLLFLQLSQTVFAVEPSKGKHILFISSYSPAFPTFFLQIDGLKAELDDGSNVLDIEFIDTKRFPGEENLARFRSDLVFKLKNLPRYDIVIVSDDDGLNFVMKYKEELFPGTPIVFMGINNIENAKKYSVDPLVTGVVEAASIADTIAMASKLNSKADRVVALTDSTSSGQGDLASYYNLQNQFSHLTFTDLDLTDMSFDEFGTALEKLSDRDLVLCLSAYKDKDGTVMTFYESLAFILKHLHQPLYHPYYHGVGKGMLGGRVISHYEQGIQAGKIANRVFGGEDISQIPVIYKSPNPYLIDYSVLKKYSLNESLLPKDTQFLNKEASPFQQYIEVILITAAGLILQAVIILSLIQNIRKRKIANLELQEALDEISSQKKHIYDILYTDMLTGMNNRLGIVEILDRLLLDSSEEEPFFILFLDIDNFKNINDTFGHDLGDQVIFETGQRLSQLESDSFMVGRFGGDEFLILLCADHAEHLDKSVCRIQECLKDIITINENQFYLTTSIGIAECPKHGETRKDLIKKADLALYEAKNSGKNKYVMFQPSMSAVVEEKVKFQSLLKEGFLKNEFSLNYQPYISSQDNKIIGFEALIRWNSPKLGQVSPYKLITNAEEIGLIVEIGNWVLEESCRFIRKINEVSDRKLLISVNISVVQLIYKNFLSDLIGITEKTGVPADWICLEMTETIMVQSLEMGHTLIRELRDYGFTVALDDFGTGYSSLSYLRSLPANILKIDKSFIDGVEDDSYNQFTLEAIINLAHQLGYTIVAEGVEKSEQLSYLVKYHCDLIQGYLLSRPMSETAAIKYVTG